MAAGKYASKSSRTETDAMITSHLGASRGGGGHAPQEVLIFVPSEIARTKSKSAHIKNFF